MAYTLINSYTLASTTNTVTFSSIPSSYIDLALVFCSRTNSSSYNVLISTSGSPNYYQMLTYNYTQNTSGVPQPATGGGNSTSIDYHYQAISSTTANTFSNSHVHFRNYAGSRMKKWIGWSGVHSNTNQGSAGGFQTSGAYYSNSTAAINSITLQPDVPASNAFQVGSTFYLYGIS
jgi:hypothetical protein